MESSVFLDISQYTEQGGRTNNEDSLLVAQTDDSVLAVVADGLGGHADGEIASRTAAQTLQRLLQRQQPDAEALTEAIRQASREICLLRGGSDMRTTVAVLWIGADRAVAAHVGDSRIYHIRQRQICYQSVDHSMAQMSVLMGEIRPEELRQSPDRNRLIRVLGGETAPKVDCRSLTVLPGDRFLLCSDGLWEKVTEQAMLRDLAETETVQQWLERMKNRVFRAADPAQDNHTAIAMGIGRIENGVAL